MVRCDSRVPFYWYGGVVLVAYHVEGTTDRDEWIVVAEAAR